VFGARLYIATKEKAMPRQYTAGEILKVAEHLEHSAARFYRAAAALHPKEANTLLALAQMEESHEARFALMEKTLPPEVRRGNGPPAFGDRHAFLEMLAQERGCEGTEHVESLTGIETLEQLLQQALDKEKHTVLFYAGIRCSLLADHAEEALDEILATEMDHMVMLSRMLQSLADAADASAARLKGLA
jgi:rubrerythrin